MKLPFVYLASRSPRRRQLLEACHILFDTVEAEIDESDYPKDLPVTEVARYLAEKKAEKALSQIHEGIVLAADSVVICEDTLMGKPANPEEARQMLELLSGKRHLVITGVCIRDQSKQIAFSDYSYVTFADLDLDEIMYYLETCAPYDKAGAYAIQEWIGHCKIIRIEGSYTNIMGLPTERVYRTLKSWTTD